jgi:alpha-mannosidase
MPFRAVAGGHAQSFIAGDDPNLVIDTIKKPEDGEGLVIRMYECHGARGTARVSVPGRYTQAILCNVLEEAGKHIQINDRTVEVAYMPHQIISIKLSH